MSLSYTVEQDSPLQTIGGVKESRDFILEKDTYKLEQKLCDYVGGGYCVALSSATWGMVLALRAAGVVAGDSVLCTSYSYFSVANIISMLGAVPILVDINPNTYNIDVYCLEYALRKCVRTKTAIPKALIAVDLFGSPCNYDAISAICGQYDVCVIEDMAHSFGASYKQRRTGSFGRFAVAAFFPNKAIGDSSDAGAVFCHTAQDVKRLESLLEQKDKSFDQIADADKKIMNPIDTSLVSRYLQTCNEQQRKRQILAARYIKNLSEHLRFQLVNKDCVSSYIQFVISLPNKQCRTVVMNALQQNQIPSQIFRPNSNTTALSSPSWDGVNLANAKVVSEKMLTIPLHPYLSYNVVDFICDCIIDALH